MKSIVFGCLLVLVLASVAYAASINFVKPVPDPSFSAGQNMKETIQKEAIEEIRTKMTNWATFSGYSARSGR